METPPNRADCSRPVGIRRWTSNVSEAPVIIVGAGIGGLTAALELAVKGRPVLVLERQKTVGGKMRQIHFDGFAGIDSGPTVFTMRWVFDELFDQLGLDFDAHVSLKKLDLLARHGWPDGSRLDLFADTEQSVEAIGAFAGADDASAYRQFAKTSADVFETLDRTFMRASRPNPFSLTARIARQNVRGMTAIHPFRTLAAELARTFKDPRLQQLFGRYATYTGGSPYLAPATLMLIAHAERCGVWIADGGMHALAATFADLVTQHGGTVRCGAHVSDIVLSGDRVSGVQLANGETIAASAIIFNGDVSALGAGHLGRAIGIKHTRQGVRPSDRSQSAITWSAIARGASDDIAPHTVAFGPDYASEFADVFDRHRPPASPTVYIHAPDRPAGGGPVASGAPQQTTKESGERIFMLVNAPPHEAPSTPDDSEKQIAETTTAMQASIKAAGWTIPIEREATVVTTPDDFADMFPGSGGALYGRAPHGWQASFARLGAESKVPGLFLAGGSVHPGPGVPMATLSGRLAAHAVLTSRSRSAR